ncbi:hypothetical protein [Bradyrhizobium elkanii]|uniref:hypothetical protein n=1 Tax=Bradyrhizobium elkanii TaxID=29448 RepID=UPI0008413FC1|nr:hypothetical protein [Bradyrhizobium elkanii]ODM71711.1 hypothetical protein A6X20_07150 [Bradyrhizobium elkanii]ODM79084.1 hypothetical protein A6452_28735 [Bradyrhizobium elkanii]
MAFERITIVQGKAKASAGVTITQTGKTVIAVRKDLVAEAGFKAGASYNVLLGTDEDHGKIRIMLDKAGVPCARELKRTGAFFFNLGPVPAIGTTPTHQRPTEARLIDGGIEVDIPEDTGPKLLPAPKAAGAEPAADSKRSPKKDSDNEVFLNGITIDQTNGDESVTFDGEGVAVSTIEAKLVKILARPRPQVVAEAFIIGALWEKGRPPSAADQLRRLCTGDLKIALAKIGLNLNVVKGVGYQLKDAA